MTKEAIDAVIKGQEWKKVRVNYKRYCSQFQNVCKIFARYTVKDQLAPLFPRPPQEEFEMLLLLAHYHAARATFDGSPQLQEMSTKLSVALLR